jgi:hypothetical protein
MISQANRCSCEAVNIGTSTEIHLAQPLLELLEFVHEDDSEVAPSARITRISLPPRTGLGPKPHRYLIHRGISMQRPHQV